MRNVHPVKFPLDYYYEIKYGINTLHWREQHYG